MLPVWHCLVVLTLTMKRKWGHRKETCFSAILREHVLLIPWIWQYSFVWDAGECSTSQCAHLLVHPPMVTSSFNAILLCVPPQQALTLINKGWEAAAPTVLQSTLLSQPPSQWSWNVRSVEPLKKQIHLSAKNYRPVLRGPNSGLCWLQ